MLELIDENTPLYHVIQSLHGAGSTILRGNFGRVIKHYFPNEREELLELVRLKTLSSAPSRLNCSFAFPTLESARRYRNNGRVTHCIYEVRACEKCEVFVGNIRIQEEIIDFRDRLRMEQLAVKYWTQGFSFEEGSLDSEVLLPTDLRIVNIVDVDH